MVAASMTPDDVTLMRASAASRPWSIDSPTSTVNGLTIVQRSPTRQQSLIALALLAAVALAIRGPTIGDVLPHIDEQFYLLVADRLWHGDLPFIDVWDRKPVGLFLLYAAFRPFGSFGIVAYQVAAGVFATATAYVIFCIGRRIGRWDAAVLAAALYLVYLPCVGGNGGQSPVFYNFAMVTAALLLVRASAQDIRKSIVPIGAAALALVGVSIQIKYTAVIEGFGFGLFLLWLCFRRKMPIVHITLVACLLMMLAALPTALASGFYFARGDGSVFVQSNFVSIFQTNGAGIAIDHYLLAAALKTSILLLALAAAVLRVALQRQWTPLYVALTCWSFAAVVGFAAIGRYYGHYALPALVPLTLMLVPLLEVPVAAVSVTVACLLLSSLFVVPAIESKAERARYVERLTSILKPYAQQGCLYLKDGPVIVYMTTSSCLSTRYVFPEHLTTLLEAKATNATAEMRALLESRPSAITTSTFVSDKPANFETQGMIEEALKLHYRLLTSVPLPSTGVAGHDSDVQNIYVRRDLASSSDGEAPR